MAIVTKNGVNISFDSNELIREVENDILEFGGNVIVAVWVRDFDDAKIIVNYDFIDGDAPITEKEIQEGENIEKMTLENLCIYLKKQNEVV